MEDTTPKLMPHGAGPFQVLQNINNGTNKIDTLMRKHILSEIFNIVDLSPYHGDED
jgi:hypothetical protein